MLLTMSAASDSLVADLWRSSPHWAWRSMSHCLGTTNERGQEATARRPDPRGTYSVVS